MVSNFPTALNFPTGYRIGGCSTPRYLRACILLDTVVAKSEEFGLSINCKKMICMIISQKKVEESMNLKINSNTNKKLNSLTWVAQSLKMENVKKKSRKELPL